VTDRIRGFDGIRALAVLAVFLGHRTPLHATQIGHAGVLAFFALSGFLIVGILHKARLAIERGDGTFADAFGRFFKRRTLRIFPIYYLTLATLAALASIGHPIVGDKIYGPDQRLYLRFIETGWTPELEQRLLLPRHALHSAKLAIKDEREWTSALPPDLAEFCR